MLKQTLLSLITLVTLSANGQILQALGEESTTDTTLQTGEWQLDINAIAFFRDNEYNSALTDGWTLPGFRVRPTIQFKPSEGITAEAGFSALVYDGANKYPNYAYHDIGTWKGNQYQSGAHLLPWLRLKAQMGSWQLVLGDIYGGVNHHLPIAMYNPEQVLSADPEMGVQILHKGSHADFDLWCDWQSYIFEEDTHQEAFTFGLSTTYHSKANSAEPHIYLPVNILAQHRGGEQDNTSMGVQTVWNGAVGVGYQMPAMAADRLKMQIECRALGCWQQAGKLWPFKTGSAFDAEVKAQVCSNFNLTCGWFSAPSQFVSLYGAPFFSTVSIKDGAIYSGINTAYLECGWQRRFGRNCIAGANIEVLKSIYGPKNETSASFGFYMKVGFDKEIR